LGVKTDGRPAGKIQGAAFFAVLSLLILGPLLTPGYILTLDSPIAFNQDPWAHLAGLTSISTSVFGATDNSAPLSLILRFFDLFLPGWLVQKALLLLIFFLAGWGASRLPMLEGLGRYYCGVFYAVNPFTYIRFFSGQWGLLLGYALIPFVVKTLLDLLDRPDTKKGMRLALWTTLIGLAQLHALALFLGIGLVILAAKVVWGRKVFAYKPAGMALGVGLAVFALLNLYWIVPSVADAASGETVAGNFDRNDLALYQPRADSSFGVAFDVASLHGFWRGSYKYAGDFFWSWWLFFVAALFLTFLGLTTKANYRRKEWLPWAVGVLGVGSFILALGMATGVTSSIFWRAWDIVPGFSIFRDSHKFLAGLALAYAFLGGLGVQELKRQITKSLSSTGGKAWAGRGAALAVVLPIAIAFPIFGAAGQLGTTQYPKDWHETRDILGQDEHDYNVLFLPWHMYSWFDWLPNDDKTLASPSMGFFGRNVISGDNIEYGTYSQSRNPVSDYVEYLLAKPSEVHNLGELLAPLNVKYVILAHEADYGQYGYLDRQGDLEALMRGQSITLYKNKHLVSPVYSPGRVYRMSRFDRFVEISREEDVLGGVFVLERQVSPSGVPFRGNPDFGVPAVKKEGMTGYSVDTSQGEYLALATKYGTTMRHWRKDGDRPVAVSLGMSPVFSSDGSPASITFGRRNWMLILVVTALLTAVAGLAYVVLPEGRLRRRWPIKRVSSEQAIRQ